MYKIFRQNGKLIGGHDPLIEGGMEVLFEIDSGDWDVIAAAAPPELLAELLKPVLPPAMGSKIVEEIEGIFDSTSVVERIALANTFRPLKEILLSKNCNPLTAEDCTEILAIFENLTEININIKTLVSQMITDYLAKHQLQ